MLHYAEETAALDATERERWVAECDEMVAFAVSSPVSINATSGCFRMNDFDTSLSGVYYFGASFLDAAGYFAPGEPFWANGHARHYANNQTLCCTLTKCLEATGMQDATAQAALSRFQGDCPVC